jgi:major curlin subunit
VNFDTKLHEKCAQNQRLMSLKPNQNKVVRLYNAKNADEARAIRAGLGMYSVAKAIQSGADIHQIGRDNMAGIGQFGQGNVGIIDQHGNNHNASLTQNGNNNVYGIFQHGAGATSHVVQTGDYGAGIIVQYGW